MFLCDEVIPIIRVLVLNRGSNNAKKMIIDNLALKDYSSMQLTTQSFVVKNIVLNLLIEFCTDFLATIPLTYSQKA